MDSVARANPSAFRSAIDWLIPSSLLLVAGAVLAAEPPAGTVTHLSGTLSVKRGDAAVRTLATRSTVSEGDTLTTESGTYARVKFADGAEVVLKPNTQLHVGKYRYQESEPAADAFAISLLKGGLRAVTGLLGKRNPGNVSVSTATATIGIRGTHFGVLDCVSSRCDDIATLTGKPPEEGVHVDVADGTVVLSNAAGQVELTAGQFGHVRSKANVPQIVPPTQGIRVTMPTGISRNSGGSIGAGREAACAL